MRRTDSNIKLRLAEVADAGTVAAILYESFIGYKRLYTHKAFEATTLGMRQITQRIKDKKMWVAFYNDVMSATVSLEPADDVMQIRSVAVAPAVRGRGVGWELMVHAEDEARKSQIYSLVLTTTPFLFEAIRLYERFGFKSYGSDDLHGTPLIKMKKIIKPAVALTIKPLPQKLDK
jgi:N-acetylglutamate synthase-like GNAT family acetyltransferase